MAPMVPATVTIGLPVYNGANFIAQAIESHLDQTYEDFRLVISDNASEDRTPEICEGYAASDDRVVYIRREDNVGVAGNFNATFDRCRSPYFKWAAHDDLVASTYLERCLEALESDDGAVLACSKIGRIDQHGERVGLDAYRLRVGASRPSVRFHDLVCRRHSCFQIFGVIRSEVLARTPLMQSFVGSDRNLLAEIALHGRFHVVGEVLFERRVHTGSYSVARLTRAERSKMWGLDAKARWSGSRRVRAEHYLESVDRVPLDDAERRACRRVVRIDYPASRVVRMAERSAVGLKNRLLGTSR